MILNIQFFPKKSMILERKSFFKHDFELNFFLSDFELNFLQRVRF